MGSDVLVASGNLCLGSNYASYERLLTISEYSEAVQRLLYDSSHQQLHIHTNVVIACYDGILFTEQHM